MKKGIEWQLFPKNLSCPSHLHKIVDAFVKQLDSIDSTSNQLDSNTVLGCLTNDFASLGYEVEMSKKDEDKIESHPWNKYQLHFHYYFVLGTISQQ